MSLPKREDETGQLAPRRHLPFQCYTAEQAVTPITLTSTRRPMSSLSISFIIVGLLIVLIGYAFIYQDLEKRRKQRQRLMAALKSRNRSVKSMLASFEPRFLPKDHN